MRDRFDIDQVLRITGLGIRADQADGGADFDIACRIAVNKIRKAKEYEDLEEQGKLLKLPCTVGDTVYWVNDWFYDGKIGLNRENHITESKVSRFFYNDLGLFVKLKNGENIPVSDFIKTVFLTKPEAEQTLKEMEDMGRTADTGIEKKWR